MDVATELESYRARVEEALAEAMRRCPGPPSLLEAMSYSLFARGKRLRPVLLLATRAIFPPGGLDPMPAACALEFIHTYSLIHDDLPALDNDDLRRGQPSCHRRFGEAMAILAGDALLTHAFWLMADAYRDQRDGAATRIIAEIAAAAGPGGMVGGQVLDTIDTGSPVTESLLRETHRMKTGALIRAAVRCGALLGGASASELDALTACAEGMGLAFQVADDCLDVTATAADLGKTPGKDRTRGKITYVDIKGLEGAKGYARDLVEEAISFLAPFGEQAAGLINLARLFVERTY